jgi:purine nucleosidase
MTWAPLDVTTKVNIDQAGVDRIRSAGTPFHEAVARQVEQYPRFAGQGSTHLHDPLAAASIIRPGLVELTDLHIDIELESRLARGATLMRTASESLPVTGGVALKIDAPAAETFIVERIAERT